MPCLTATPTTCAQTGVDARARTPLAWRLNEPVLGRTIEAPPLEHNRMLEHLPDAVREKIGFHAPGA